jgi:probable S-adenosylmethionine-dependent methyltransferase, YraL family
MTSSASVPANSASKPGRLYVVATPIGNLGDISHRAVQILASVDCIACEDTRHTKKLCRHLNITTPLVSYFREREQEKATNLLKLLYAGKQIALVSDAGTPALCDPGAVLVNKARAAGIEVVAVAGPSALTAALSISGLLQAHFFFGGFLPANANARRQLLKTIVALPWILIFYETPHRIKASIADMIATFGDRQAQLFRELTKIHEECLEGPLSVLHERVQTGIKGELVLIVHGAAPQAEKPPENLDDLLRWYRDEHRSSLKQAVVHIATDLDLPRSHVYKKALTIWQETAL